MKIDSDFVEVDLMMKNANYKLSSTTIKVYITSLNLHFAEIYSGTEYWEPERQRC